MEKLVTQEMMMEHDGKRMGGDSEYWIYLTNLKAYSEGFLLGVYLHLPFSDKDLEQAYKQILVGNEFVDSYGCSYEEYFISDYDMPFSVNEYDFPQKLAERFDGLENYLHYSREVIELIAGNEGYRPTIFELNDSEMMSNDEKLGYALVDEALIPVPAHLGNYLDYEAIGRDYRMTMVGEFVGNYYIEFL